MTTAADLAEVLSMYAQDAENGVIVELGSYHGKGTVALARGTAKGSRRTIHTIDDYERKRGWIGELYEPGDYINFLNALVDVSLVIGIDVIQHKMTFDRAVETWVDPIALLYWDPGMRERCLWDFERWSPHVIKGGVYVIKDTPHDDLNSSAVIDTWGASDSWEIEREHRGVTFLRRIR